jgi:hypothetical protein
MLELDAASRCNVSLRKSRFSFANRVEERRRNLTRSQDINQDEDGIEMDSPSHTLASAINYAFIQPDINSKNRTLIRLNCTSLSVRFNQCFH